MIKGSLLNICSVIEYIFIILYSLLKNTSFTIPIFTMLGLEIIIQFGFLLFILPENTKEKILMITTTIWITYKSTQGVLILLQIMKIIHWEFYILIIPFWVANLIILLICSFILIFCIRGLLFKIKRAV